MSTRCPFALPQKETPWSLAANRGLSTSSLPTPPLLAVSLFAWAKRCSSLDPSFPTSGRASLGTTPPSPCHFLGTGEAGDSPSSALQRHSGYDCADNLLFLLV